MSILLEIIILTLAVGVILILAYYAYLSAIRLANRSKLFVSGPIEEMKQLADSLGDSFNDLKDVFSGIFDMFSVLGDILGSITGIVGGACDAMGEIGDFFGSIF